MSSPNLICLHCGLLCELPGDCAKREKLAKELDQVDARHLLSTDVSDAAQTLVYRIKTSDSPTLLRLDSLDVDSARSVLRFALKSGCRVTHCGATEQQPLREVASRHGWISSTIADAASHADLIWLISDTANELPLLKSRLGSKPKLIHIELEDPAAASKESNRTSASTGNLVRMSSSGLFWLLNSLTQTLEGSDLASTSSCEHPTQYAEQLLLELKTARSVCIVWPASIFADDSERFIIQRLNTLSQQLTDPERICSLLPIGQDAGMVTSEEVMLWTTGSTEGAFVASNEFKTAFSQYDGQPNQDSGNSIFVRSLTSERPITHGQGELVIAPAFDVHRLPKTPANMIGLQVSGIDTDATLFRGDKAVTLHISASRKPADGFSCKDLFDRASQIWASGGQE